MAPLPVRFLSPFSEDSTLHLELAGLLYLPASTAGVPAPGLVVGHGAGSKAARHRDFCIEARTRGFVVLAFDFRGHGDSGGSGDGPLEQDVMAAAQYLRMRPDVDGERVCYRGSSMGGFYGLKAGPDARFSAIALVCPASEATMLDAIDRNERSPDRDTETPDDRVPDSPAPEPGAGLRGRDAAPDQTSLPDGTPPRWDTPRLRAYFERQDSRVMAERVDCPVLLLHAREDEVVPFAHSLVLARHLRTETTLLALSGGTHTSAQHDPAIHAYTADWLWQKVAR